MPWAIVDGTSPDPGPARAGRSTPRRIFRGQRDAQPGLAAAARPSQRDQVAAPKQPFGLRIAIDGTADGGTTALLETSGIYARLCQPGKRDETGGLAAGDLSR